jgi:hypothetical protein
MSQQQYHAAPQIHRSFMLNTKAISCSRCPKRCNIMRASLERSLMRSSLLRSSLMRPHQHSLMCFSHRCSSLMRTITRAQSHALIHQHSLMCFTHMRSSLMCAFTSTVSCAYLMERISLMCATLERSHMRYHSLSYADFSASSRISHVQSHAQCP